MKRYQSTKVVVGCPACGGTNGRVLYTVNSDQAAQHYVLREVYGDRHLALKDHIEDLWGKTTCDVVSCNACGFCFANPYVAGDRRFYSLAYERSGYPHWKWEYDYALSSLRRLDGEGVLKNFRLLEIGAGNGAFVSRVAPELTPIENVVCTEYSGYGTEVLRQRGFKVIAADVRDDVFESYAGYFDVICLFQVLEHLDRLDELFERLELLGTDGAHLIVAVPNAKRIEFNELNEGLLEMPPNHIGRWGRHSFEAISERHGWRLVGHEIEARRPFGAAIEHIVQRYMKKRQDPNTLANRTERVRQRIPRRLLQVFLIGIYSLTGLRAILKLVGNKDLGLSQVAHFQKITSQ